jgi:hypothetical protein
MGLPTGTEYISELHFPDRKLIDIAKVIGWHRGYPDYPFAY